MKGRSKTLWGALSLFLLLGLVLSSSITADAADLKPKLQVVKSAQVTNVSYEVKPYKGKDRLHVTVELKNVTKEPKRYRVNIWLPDGVSGGGFYPRKGKAMEAGKTLSQTFPMYYDKIPSKMEIMVKELPTD
jgi:hypothetical protein